MAMSKAEMEQHYSAHNRFLLSATSAYEQNRFGDAIKFACDALNHVDGMMRYARKYNDAEFNSVASIDLIFQLAPIMLDQDCLDRVEALLRERRTIQKNTTEDLSKSLAGARRLLFDAYRIADHLERHGCSQATVLFESCSLKRPLVEAVVKSWVSIHYVTTTSSNESCEFELVTDFDRVTRGKCPACGATAKAGKSRFLKAATCPRCKKTVSFVLLEADKVA